MSNEKFQMNVRKEKNPQYSQQAFFTPAVRYTLSPTKKPKRRVAAFSYNLYNEKKTSAGQQPATPNSPATKADVSQLILSMPEEYRNNPTLYRN